MSNDVAQTIFKQLGGQKFATMTGAKNFTSSPATLSFRIGRNKTETNHVMIVLQNDLYTMVFSRVSYSTRKGFDFKEVRKFDGVYFDQLQAIFTEVTGLYTSLGRIAK